MIVIEAEKYPKPGSTTKKKKKEKRVNLTLLFFTKIHRTLYIALYIFQLKEQVDCVFILCPFRQKETNQPFHSSIYQYVIKKNKYTINKSNNM